MIIIGEKINATLPGINQIIESRDTPALVELATSQAAAGADFIDVNVGTGVGSFKDEIIAMEWAVQAIQGQVDTPLCIDSADPAVLEAGLKARNGKPSLINSTKAEEKNLKQVVSLASDFQSLLVGLAMDETGIPATAGERVRACEKIANACGKHGVPLRNLYFDPLVLPVSTDIKQGLVTLNALGVIKEEFPGAKTVMGLSNVSYGLPGRSLLNTAFLHMAIYAGLDAAVMDPLDERLVSAITVAEALTGKDRYCRRYTKSLRGKN